MPLIDWQDLYASNRAVIEGRDVPPGAVRAPGSAGPRPRIALPAGLSGLPGTSTDPGELAGLRTIPTVPGELAGLRTIPTVPGDLSGLRTIPTVPGDLAGLRSSMTPATVPGSGSWSVQELDRGGRPGEYALYRPATLPPGPAPLLVLLHGCTQSPSDLAVGTRMHEQADAHGFLVAYPRQTADANPQACWNWFDPAQQRRDGAEPGFVLAVVDAVLGGAAGVAVDPARVFLAGMSAGGAMAAIVAATYPDRVAGLAVHSGLPVGSAQGVQDAFGAMARGAEGARLRLPRRVPAIVVHGTADRTVSPDNGRRLAAQWLAAHDGAVRGEARIVRGRVEGGYAYERRRWADGDGVPVVEYIEVDGLGHAWSGGDAAGSYADPRGPSASEALWRFLADARAR